MSEIKETKEVTEIKQHATIQSPTPPSSQPLDISSNNPAPISNTTDPTALEEKEHSRQLGDMKAMSSSPMPATSNSNNMRELLRPGYEARAILLSILCGKDEDKTHPFPIHEVHFTIDEYDEEQEEAKLGEKLDTRDEKESKHKARSDGDAKTDRSTSPRDAWSSSLHHQRGGENARQPVSIADIFKPRQQLTSNNSSEAKIEHKMVTSHTASAVHRVLILGQAGSGKTTLSKYLADAWIKGELWPQCNQMFWISARDMHSIDEADIAACAASPFPLAALIHRLCFTTANPNKITDKQKETSIEAIDRLLKTQPQQTVLVLDGFDEVAKAFSGSTTTAKNITTLLTAALNTNCDLIVTSRGYSRPPSSIKFDRQLVNQGFSDAQVSSYIQRYFTSLPKPDAKLATEVQQLLQRNYRLWTHAHNPLILSLTCDYYRNTHKNKQKKLEELTLLNLYEKSLSVFIRRYLDYLSQPLKKPELEWKSTTEYSLDTLLNKCPVEMDFLQTLAFLGIKKGIQRFEEGSKKEAIAEVLGRYEKASHIRFTNALKLLGLMHEFPSEATSSLERVHEFAHLTFQEFLAAGYLAERLQHNDPKAYEWLRNNKYNPSYREVLNFICMLMPAEKHPFFWQVLLEEQTDRTGVGHLQLLMYSLEAAQCDSQIPKLHNHINTISQALIGYIKAPTLEKVTWLPNALEYCPQVLGQLMKDNFWQEVLHLLRIKETARQASTLLSSMMRQAQQFTSQRREWLLAALLRAARDKEWDVRNAAIDALKTYSAQAAHFSPEARDQLLKVVLHATKDKESDMRKAAIHALGTCAVQAAHFLPEARGQLLKALLQAAGDKKEDVREEAIQALGACAAQAAHFPPEARGQLLKALLQAAGDKKEDVRQEAIQALRTCGAQAAHFPPEARGQLLKALLQAAGDKKEDVRQEAIQALGACAAQTAHFPTGSARSAAEGTVASGRRSKMGGT